ncbi:MAG: hypothetical protein M3Q29_23195 [Chloroflexota bacterium]|nr:hypothetical protein [Chloroflexota bacterium]
MSSTQVGSNRDSAPQFFRLAELVVRGPDGVSVEPRSLNYRGLNCNLAQSIRGWGEASAPGLPGRHMLFFLAAPDQQTAA